MNQKMIQHLVFSVFWQTEFQENNVLILWLPPLVDVYTVGVGEAMMFVDQ